MGELLDDLISSPKSETGRKSTWPQMLMLLPEDVVADIMTAFVTPGIEVAQIKRAVEARFPDAPVRSVSTWQNWARCARRGDL